MNKDDTLKNLSNLASGLFSSLEGVRNHSKQIIKSMVKANLKNFDLVNREEFEEIKSMIIKAREQNSILEGKIKTLEKKLKNRK